MTKSKAKPAIVAVNELFARARMGCANSCAL